jgi:predicted nucleic acid-binding protein
MTFVDLQAGDAVFVDANILIYHFQPHPVLGPRCTDLLRRVENQELIGFTSTHVLSEVSHRLSCLQPLPL